MEETRISWLNLLNFMRFLRYGLIRCVPGENWLGCPVWIVKARYGVLLECPAAGRILYYCGGLSCGIAATAVGWALDV